MTHSSAPSMGGHVALLFLCLLAGCAVDPFPLCDGSADVRFSYRVAGGFYEDPFEAFMNPDGLAWFEVKGDCSYRAYSRSWYGEGVSNVYSWNLVHAGTLSQDDAAALSEDLDLGRWARWDDRDVGSTAPVPDAATTTVQVGDTVLTCISCDTSKGDQVQEGVSSVLDDLLVGGTPIESTTPRVVVGEVGPAEQVAEEGWIVEWGAADPLSTFLAQDDGRADLGRTVPAEAADWFLQTRHAYRDALPDLGHYGQVAPCVLDGSGYYGVFIRDDWSGKAMPYPIEGR